MHNITWRKHVSSIEQSKNASRHAVGGRPFDDAWGLLADDVVVVLVVGRHTMKENRLKASEMRNSLFRQKPKDRRDLGYLQYQLRQSNVEYAIMLRAERVINEKTDRRLTKRGEKDGEQNRLCIQSDADMIQTEGWERERGKEGKWQRETKRKRNERERERREGNTTEH
jgi:hypothetical protein